MKIQNRFVIYFHYDPHGQADSACLLMLCAIRKVAARVLFVTNGRLTEASARSVRESGAEVLERENTGLDVGAYREALNHWTDEERAACGELVLMNYTLAGPVHPLEEMFAAMDARPELDFWGITRHYAMKSRRFKTAYGEVPEHIQSHFLAIRPRLFCAPAFWDYWNEMKLPATYEESVARHEARFTRLFADLGFRWDTYVNTADLESIFINPIMGCPAELAANRGCPVFKRRSFFTPYREELRRTAGEAAGELYAWLKTATDYPVDELVKSLLANQPLQALFQNLHWNLLLSPMEESAADTQPIMVLELNAALAKSLPAFAPGTVVCLVQPFTPTNAGEWYTAKAAQALYQDPTMLAAVAASFAGDPLLGLVSPAVPAYAPLYEQRINAWNAVLPLLRRAVAEYPLTVPLEESQPLPVPFASCVFLRAEAFPAGIPALSRPENWWLLPLIAQQNGYASKAACPAAWAARQLAVTADTLYRTQEERELTLALARKVKHRLQKGRAL